MARANHYSNKTKLKVKELGFTFNENIALTEEQEITCSRGHAQTRVLRSVAENGCSLCKFEDRKEELIKNANKNSYRVIGDVTKLSEKVSVACNNCDRVKSLVLSSIVSSCKCGKTVRLKNYQPSNELVLFDGAKYPKNRRSAISLKSEFYFTSKKCKRGHLALRLSKDSSCIECNKEDKPSYFIFGAGFEFSFESLSEVFSYCTDTGVISLRVETSNQSPGEEFLFRMVSGYKTVRISDRHFQYHRLAWFLMTGEWPNVIDHINGIRDDNRWCNLRNVNRLENSRNQKMRSENTSGVTGVGLIKSSGKWRAEIGIKGKTVTIGTFDNFDDAVRARKKAEREYGFHPNHGRKQ